MRVALIAMTLMWPMTAFSQDAPSLEEQAAMCWSIPAGLETLFASEFDVVLGAKGEVEDITVTRFDETAKGGRELVKSASRAIERCSPYRTDKTGTVKFTMDPMPLFEGVKTFDPFKAKQD